MRLITRSDFDGLISGAILKSCGVIDEWLFVHPKDIQDSVIRISSNDVLVNVPYVKGCGMWFDHHKLQLEKCKDIRVPGERRADYTCARLIYDYYMGDIRFPQLAPMIDVCEKVFRADLNADEILHPSDELLFAFLLDPRTGLGRFHDFRISNLALMDEVLDSCCSLSFSEIMSLPDVLERRDLYLKNQAEFEDFLQKYSRICGNTVLTDLRGKQSIPPGNRFVVYAVFSEQNSSVWVVDGKNKKNVSIAVGISIINKTCAKKANEICEKFGGGGHESAATCQVSYQNADNVIDEVLQFLKQ